MAAAEYLLVGAGLVLFFVLLLAFAEVIGFAFAYLGASAAIIGLLTAYSAAVLGSWARARFIGALLVGLYALLYVLLNLEAWSLMIGSLLLFVALAGVMYATRKIDWGSVGPAGSCGDLALSAGAQFGRGDMPALRGLDIDLPQGVAAGKVLLAAAIKLGVDGNRHGDVYRSSGAFEQSRACPR